jgi:hypothetical protein
LASGAAHGNNQVHRVLAEMKSTIRQANRVPLTSGTRKPSGGRSVVVGVADHSGWAFFVSVAAVNGVPTVIDRRRVRLIDNGVPSQPYEHDTRALNGTEAERLLRDVKRSITACTALAFDRLSADLSPYRVTAIAIRQPPLARLPATAEEVHSSYHTLCRADGMLYHAAICAAARQRDWPLAFHRRGDELTMAAEALRTSPDVVERFMDDLKPTLKAPWTSEHRRAFAAAIASLGKT